MSTPTVIMNFSHVYEEEDFYGDERAVWIDCSDIPGTDCYCTEEAEAAIRSRIRDFPPEGIHFLDSGNFHYVSMLWMEKIRVPFHLLVFDYHSDMQPPLFAELLSCGCWISRALDANPFLRRVWIVGPDASAFDHLDARYRDRLVCISLQDVQRREAFRELARIEPGTRLYVSIDKDVLDRHFSRTNWNQGALSLETLERLTATVADRARLIGIDICGELDRDTALWDIPEVHLNAAANRELLRFFREKVRRDGKARPHGERNRPA